MTNHSGHGHWRSGNALSIVALVAAFTGFAVLTVANAARLGAQTHLQSEGGKGPLPSFEVASIKLDRSESGHRSIGLPPGRFNTMGTSAKFLIEYAYSLASDAQLSGGPSWINSDKYQIEAKVDDALADTLQKLPLLEQYDRLRLMVRSLLIDRFKLKVSYTTRQLPIYALVVMKGGAKFTPASNAHGNGSTSLSVNVKGTTGELAATNAPINSLLEALARQPELAGRTLVDQTGLKGRYDLRLHWTREDLAPQPNDTNRRTPVANAPLVDSSGPSLFTAVREQLGLKLESQKGPVEVLVIDHIEHPSEN